MTQQTEIKKETIFAVDVADKLYSDTVSVFNDSVHMTVGPDLKNRVKSCLKLFNDSIITELTLLEDKMNYSENFKAYVSDRIIFFTEVNLHIDRI